MATPEQVQAAKAQANADSGRVIELRAKIEFLQVELAQAVATFQALKAAAAAALMAETTPLEIKKGMAVHTPKGGGVVSRAYGNGNCSVLLNKRDRKGREIMFNFSASELTEAGHDD